MAAVERGVTEHPSRTDMAQVDAIIAAQSDMYTLGYRDGHAAGVLESDRRVSDSVRNMLADLREGRLL